MKHLTEPNLQTRISEARKAINLIELNLEFIEKHAEEMSTGDYGSLSHSVRLLEESAVALGVPADTFENN